jgi:hypothetical protein
MKIKNIDPIRTFSDQTFILPQYDEQGRAFVEAKVRCNIPSLSSVNVRGVLVNKCAGQHNLKTVLIREIMWK